MNVLPLTIGLAVFAVVVVLVIIDQWRMRRDD